MKSTENGNFFYVFLRVESEKRFGMGDSAGHQVVAWSCAKTFAIFPNEIIFADKKNLGQFVQRYFFVIMGKNIFSDLYQFTLDRMCVGQPFFALREAGSA